MTLDAATRNAYLETEFWVYGQPRWALRIGVRSEPLAELLRQHVNKAGAGAAFISACNPFSQPLSADENAALHRQLGSELQAGGLPHWEGIGQHPGNGWPGEPSYLVLNLGCDEACSLGRRLQQNAIVWVGADAVPDLLVLVS